MLFQVTSFLSSSLTKTGKTMIKKFDNISCIRMTVLYILRPLSDYEFINAFCYTKILLSFE